MPSYNPPVATRKENELRCRTTAHFAGARLGDTVIIDPTNPWFASKIGDFFIPLEPWEPPAPEDQETETVEYPATVETTSGLPDESTRTGGFIIPLPRNTTAWPPGAAGDGAGVPEGEPPPEAQPAVEGLTTPRPW